jgi:hypothetical protein
VKVENLSNTVQPVYHKSLTLRSICHRAKRRDDLRAAFAVGDRRSWSIRRPKSHVYESTEMPLRHGRATSASSA